MEQLWNKALKVINQQSMAIEELCADLQGHVSVCSSLYNGSRIDHCSLVTQVTQVESVAVENKWTGDQYLRIVELMDQRLDSITPLVSLTQR